MRRRSLVAATALLPFATRAQDKWPTRPVKLVVPFAAGGTTDLVARLVAPPMSQALGQQVVVDNKAGAAGMLGSDAVAKAKDGFTLGIGTVSTHAIGPALMRQPPYRPDADFAPIAIVGTTPLAVFVHPSVATTLTGLADKARREPGVYNFGSPGSGSLGHLAGVWFNTLTGAELMHVPYRGSSPALQDLLAGRVHVLFDNIPTALSQVQSGSVRALAVTAPTRAAVLPDVPSVREAGLPDFEILSWTMLLAPAATAATTIDAANAALNAAVRDAAVRDRFAEAGVDGRGGTASDAAAFLRVEIAKWQPIAKQSGVVLD
ncbi:MAG: tripartite tricarboxylate transporter substrate binding protein [Rhodospirillales bacterium]|nr:tripartite tricarboxylate transporter substrate binding protein [Rhodospirillales bacterium]